MHKKQGFCKPRKGERRIVNKLLQLVRSKPMLVIYHLIVHLLACPKAIISTTRIELKLKPAYNCCVHHGPWKLVCCHFWTLICLLNCTLEFFLLFVWNHVKLALSYPWWKWVCSNRIQVSLSSKHTSPKFISLPFWKEHELHNDFLQCSLQYCKIPRTKMIDISSHKYSCSI